MVKTVLHNVWSKIKNWTVTFTGKIRIGFIEIAVAPGNIHRPSTGLFFIFSKGIPIYSNTWRIPKPPASQSFMQ